MPALPPSPQVEEPPDVPLIGRKPPVIAPAFADPRARLRETLRREQNAFKINTPDPSIHRELERGWMLTYLLPFEDALYGRWEYWMELQLTGALPDRPIPRLDFLPTPHSQTWKMLERTLDAIPHHGSGGWRGWSSSEYVRYFLAWFLWGVGHGGQTDAPCEPAGCEGASDRLYQIFNVGALLLFPYDYMGEMLAQNAYGKGHGFYPTPHNVVEMMVQMTMGEGDHRLASVCDPCVGTGRMLLHASNFSLDLAGVDIDATMCQTTLMNGFLYAPWLVKPLPGLRASTTGEMALQVSDAIAAQAPPHVAATLADTEYDAQDAWHYEPIKKRRKKNSQDTQQSSLF